MSLLMDALRKADKAQQEKTTPPAVLSVAPKTKPEPVPAPDDEEKLEAGLDFAPPFSPSNDTAPDSESTELPWENFEAVDSLPWEEEIILDDSPAFVSADAPPQSPASTQKSAKSTPPIPPLTPEASTPVQTVTPANAQNLYAAAAKSRGNQRSTWLFLIISALALLVLIGGGAYFYREMTALQSSPFIVPPPGEFRPPEGGLQAQLQARKPAPPIIEEPPPASVSAPPESVPVQAAAPDSVKTPPQKPPAPAVMNSVMPEPEPLDEALQIKRRPASQVLNDTVLQAWRRYQSGDFVAAEQDYRHALKIAPRERQALLGLAASLLGQGQHEAARQTYEQILHWYPQDSAAESALINMAALGADSDSESLLKIRLHEQPQQAYLHFALGNLYSRQQRWAEAQSAYFEAYRHDNNHPDYAYNLAVSLEHLGKSAIALEYYEKALRLSEQRAVNFERARLLQRIALLRQQ
jgi:tetratricopeptide (TPR) repeat protein